MALILFSGFETGDLTEWTGGSGTYSVQTSTKRTGAYALRCNPTTTGTGYINWNPPSNSPGPYYTRFYFNYATKPSSTEEIIYEAVGPSGSASHYITLNSSGVLNGYTGSGTPIGTGSTVLSSATWYRIEIKSTINGTNSSSSVCDLKINGSSEWTSTYDSGGTWFINSINFGKYANLNSKSVDFFYDDVFIDDAAYIGAGQSTAMFPTASGTYSDWSGTYADVDETPNDGATTAISSTTANDVSTFNFTDTASTTPAISGTINGVHFMAYGYSNTGMSTDMKLRVRTHSTNYDTTKQPGSSGTYALMDLLQSVNPNTGTAWTTGELDAVEFGVFNNFGFGMTESVSALYAMVDYTPSGGTTYNDSMTGGVVVDGSNAVSKQTSVATSGAINVDGSDTVSKQTSVATSGAINVDGTSPNGYAYLEATDGGVVVDGSNPVSLQRTNAASGAINVDGSNPVSLQRENAATGGVLVDGSNPVSLQTAIATTGGVLADGSNEVSLQRTNATTGGVVVDGSNPVSLQVQDGSSGGVVLSGNGTQNTYQELMSGGVLVDGSNEVSLQTAIATDGGALVDGSNPVSLQRTNAASGAVNLDSSNVVDQIIYSPLSSGGANIDGTASDQYTFYESMTGGCTVGGTDPVAFEDHETFDGGAVVDGSSNVSKKTTVATSGAVLAGGSASIYSIFNNAATGGVKISQPIFSNGFNYRRKITIPANSVGSNLTQFPLAVQATLNTANVGVQSFRCETTTGTLLASELVRYNSTNGKISLFVQTDLNASTANYFYLYYGS